MCYIFSYITTYEVFEISKPLFLLCIKKKLILFKWPVDAISVAEKTITVKAVLVNRI